MTAIAPSAPPTRAAATTSPTTRLSFGRVVRSEFLKLLTLRSTWWSLAITGALTVGLAALIAGASSSFGPGLSPVAAITLPIQFTMLVAGILGAMAITGEYSTGMIRSTLTAEPCRGRVLLAKAVVVAVTLVLLAAVTTVIAGLVVMPILGADAYAWGDVKELWLPLALSLLAMATFGLLGLGWGFVIRNGAGAIATTVGILFVLPIVLQLFMMFGESWQWVVELGRWLPSNATAALTNVDGADFWPSLVAAIAWPAGTLLLGWGVLRTRDA
ncbi:ABC transporter permease subunit [Microbacterium oleivorans]|uniref:ABC transporter permease subunit n=1 Tax=Microbacterium oleivorans TaxID=273677 RepID=UPI00203E7B8E|nr:ABC transporter permease subunit [Microbacterium oleivorans]MCM3696765.1 ABC transporter permease subunit [Microbacterium oleivorans]